MWKKKSLSKPARSSPKGKRWDAFLAGSAHVSSVKGLMAVVQKGEVRYGKAIKTICVFYFFLSLSSSVISQLMLGSAPTPSGCFNILSCSVASFWSLSSPTLLVFIFCASFGFSYLMLDCVMIDANPDCSKWRHQRKMEAAASRIFWLFWRVVRLFIYTNRN